MSRDEGDGVVILCLTSTHESSDIRQTEEGTNSVMLTSLPAPTSSRSSVCRMSSKDKMNVQDQSKERGVSGGLELSEEKESSPGKPAAESAKLSNS